MLRISLRCKSEALLRSFLSLRLLPNMHSHFNVLCICSCFWISYSSMSSFQKGKREKNETLVLKMPWKSLPSECNNVGMFNTNCYFLFAPLYSAAAISNQSIAPLYVEIRVMFAHSGSPEVCASCFWNRCIAACHEAKERVIGNCNSFESWNWLKLTSITIQLSLWKMKAFNRLQNSYIRQRFCLSYTNVVFWWLSFFFFWFHFLLCVINDFFIFWI